MDKTSMFKAEKFATKIIGLAAEEKMTVEQLHYAADVVKEISNKSTVESVYVDKNDFPSRQRHISVTCDEKELFSI